VSAEQTDFWFVIATKAAQPIENKLFSIGSSTL